MREGQAGTCGSVWNGPDRSDCFMLVDVGGRGRIYTVAVSGLVVAAGAVAWRTWSRTSVGPFDPVSAVIAMAGLAVSLAAFGLAWRAQRQADADVAAAASRLAVAVAQTETEARRQLLGRHDRTIDVRFAFQPAPAHNAAGASSKGTLKEIASYYRKLQPRRMVITGAAGSGKTVLAVELILGLLDERTADAPVPVRMSAASLDTSRPTGSAMEAWLTEHLQQNYGLSITVAGQLVAARMVIPVLDGLDEMDAIETPGYSSRAGRAIRACNSYLDAGQKGAIVLTCRIRQYEALEQAQEWVHDAACIQLHPVGVAAARSFLIQRVTDAARWSTVLDQMRRSGNQPLARALDTPWRLTLAATVYDQRDPATGSYIHDPADLTNPRFDTEDKLRDHLLALYIPAAIAAHPGRYSPSTVHRWLGVLSVYLDSNTPTFDRPAHVVAGRTLSGSDLTLHELWPLAGSRAPRVVSGAAISAISAGLAAFMLTHVPIEFTLRAIAYASFMCLYAIYSIGIASEPWPKAKIVDLRHLKSRQALGWLPFGLTLGVAVCFVLGLPSSGSSLGLTARLAIGLGFGVLLGLAMGLGEDPDQYSVADPRQVLRSTVQMGLAFGPLAGLLMGIAIGTSRIPIASTAGLTFGVMTLIVLGPLGFPWDGFPFLRFIALLLCTRRWNNRWLPWRLGSFLDWCYQAGLIRIAGISYQLRHRELQDYLARNPLPCPPLSPTEPAAIPTAAGEVN